MPEIEKELREGVTLRDIHSAMQENYGLGLSFNGFRNALYRARNECAKGNLPATQQAEVMPAAEKREVLPAKEEREGSPAQDVEKAEAPKTKRGILSTKDIRPDPSIEEELEKLASKKYERGSSHGKDRNS